MTQPCHTQNPLPVDVNRPYPHRNQTGYILLEVLVATVIFSLGLLGMLALYATSIKNNTDAKYRMDACFLADTLMTRMWTGDRDPEVLQTDYQGGSGTNGDGYTHWLDQEVSRQLPGTANSPPSVSITPDLTVGKSVVRITVFWQSPGGPLHQYQTQTTISR